MTNLHFGVIGNFPNNSVIESALFRVAGIGLGPLIAVFYEVRLQGLEPWTYGLKVRCSTN